MALSTLFFLSGFSALVYQVVWQRLLSTVFGVTVYATSTVLASFMGGLALGSALGGRLADRVRRPLLAFAAAEAGIGLLAAATPDVLNLVTQAYAAAQQGVAAGSPRLTLLRGLCSVAVLIVPTTLMGATLPLVVASQAADPDGLRRRIAGLYAANTLGAFAGALLSGYVLIGRLGLIGSTRVAVAVNLLVAVGAAALASRAKGMAEAPHREAPAAGANATAVPLTTAQSRTLLAVFGVSGLVALGLEVVWFRLLTAYLPTTSYAFTTMLATVLAGIGIGGALAGRRGRPAPGELGRLGVLLAWMGVLAVLSANVLARTYAAGWKTSGLIQACIVALMPATLLMGVSYPRGLALWTRASPRTGSRVGVFGAANLGGGILGSLIAGFALIPWLGTRGSLIVLAALAVAGGLALALVDAGGSRRATAIGGALLAFAAAALTLPDAFTAALAKRHRGDTALWREESVQATVAVHRDRSGQRVLYIDGAHQADDSETMRALHRRIGLLPLALHPGPRRALVIGLAGGATPAALATEPDLDVDVVELSEAVVRASAWFQHVNGDLLRRPNVRLSVGDGRNHLLVTSERYDIVTADLIQPFHAGAGHLYSVEYFRLCRRVLAEDGLMVQWIGHPPEAQYKLILRSFLEAFPEASLWAPSVLVGSRRPLRISEAAFHRFQQDRPELAAALAEAGIGEMDALLALHLAGPAELRRFAGTGPLLSDDRPLTEYYLSLEGPRVPVDLSGLVTGGGSALKAP